MLLNDDFLLTTDWARRLYHNHAEHMPIVDYHCHLDPQKIYEDAHFEDLAQLWICDNGAGDHYKWRLMRANGTPEELISGDGEPYEKYLAFVRAIEKAPGNPLYEWSHLELSRAFGIDLTINEYNAEEIWNLANERISEPDFSTKGLIRKFDVTCLCTTDDPASDLKWHKLLREEEDQNGFRVLPTFRPDGLLGIERDTFCDYVSTLSAASGIEVTDYESLKAATVQRVDFFHEVGGRFADHGMNTFYFNPASEEEVAQIVARRLAGEEVSAEEVGRYQTAMTLYLLGLYKSHGWTCQLHANCFRNDSALGLANVGVDAGFDSAGDQPDLVYQLKCLLDAAEQADGLPKTILYTLNEADFIPMATLVGSFQGGGVRQRMTFGNAWWFLDNYSGMKKQIATCAEQGLLGNFPGMLTDSRSFLSYSRHEYFRRILCQTFGEWVEQGRLPEDEDYLGGLVEDVCYNNAHDNFGFFDD